MVGCLCGWVTNFSPNDISGPRRSKNVEFGTKVAPSTRMMHTLRFSDKVFNYGKICKEMPFFTHTVMTCICM